MVALTPLTTDELQQQARAVLERLGMGLVDLQALRAQGFVAAEYRQRGGRRSGPYHRLHWRVAGRQRIAYLGRNPLLAEHVQAALAVWQAPRNEQRASAALLRAARRALRAAKAVAAPQLAREARYFHGYSVRRRRRHAGDQGDGVSTIETDGAREGPQL